MHRTQNRWPQLLAVSLSWLPALLSVAHGAGVAGCRFARQEYIRLALEEETADDSQMDTDPPWEQQDGGTLLEMAHMRDSLEPISTGASPSPLVTPSFLV